MPKFKLVVLSRPVAGREQDYNDWYQHTHLDDILAIEGFNAAQRFKLVRGLSPGQRHPYMAIYELETDDADTALAELQRRAETGRLPVSDAMDRDIYAALFEEAGPRLTG